MKWTGLTGGIATGKSTVKKLLEGRGIPVIDADQISHRLSEPGAQGYINIVSQFGNDILFEDKSLDRKKLARLIFSDSTKKDILEGILHPLIKDEVQALRAQFEKSGVQRCFYDVPLLFEKNLKNQFDCVVLVWCDRVIQMDRLTRRSNLSETEAVLRIENQIPLVEKVAASDYCLDNSGSLHELETQLDNLLSRI